MKIMLSSNKNENINATDQLYEYLLYHSSVQQNKPNLVVEKITTLMS